MKKYYTVKLKLTPLQIEMFTDIFAEGRTGISDNLPEGEQGRLIAVETKLDFALEEYLSDLRR